MDLKKIVLGIIAVILIAISAPFIAGFVFATFTNDGENCTGEIPSKLEAGQNNGLGVTKFGLTSSEAQIKLKNNGQTTVKVKDVKIENKTAESLPSTLNVGESQIFKISDISSSESCSEAYLNIIYDQGSETGKRMTGSISDQMTIN